MPFSTKQDSTPVPTHAKWASKNKEEFGKTFFVTLILLNPEWRTITLFCTEFKLNIKYENSEDFCTNRDELYKSLKRGYCKANLTDSSTTEPLNYSCSVDIDSIPQSKGGRKYELGKNRITIEAISSSEEEIANNA